MAQQRHSCYICGQDADGTIYNEYLEEYYCSDACHQKREQEINTSYNEHIHQTRFEPLKRVLAATVVGTIFMGIGVFLAFRFPEREELIISATALGTLYGCGSIIKGRP